MKQKGSARRKKELEELQLNLNPMMDMFAVLIPALLMMSVVVESAVVNVSAPSISADSSAAPAAPTKQPLNLTIKITEKGYVLVAQGVVLGVAADAASKGEPSISVTEQTVNCSRYRSTVPPPRSRNADRTACDPKNLTETRSFWTYDTTALHQRILELKDQFPEERRVIISAEATVEYEAIADVMEASRDEPIEGGGYRALFDEVVISPGDA